MNIKGLLISAVLMIGGCLMGCGTQHGDMDFVADMGSGFNLGNSLESTCTDGSVNGLDLETYWENPKISKAMIEEIAKAGFQTIRIPVTWDVHMDEKGQIDAAWMDRVQEVVDAALDTGMYVILNAHHDTWYIPSKENEAYAKEMMEKVWSQIAEQFAEYDEKLLFEGMNEPRLIGTDVEWAGESKENDQIVDELNQLFVDTVRNSGGNNRGRYLLVTSYADAIESIDRFTMPKGTHLIVTVHAYKPYAFAMDETGTAVWEPGLTQEIKGFMDNLQRRFTSKGIPVIIGEFGSIDKNNLNDREQWLKDYITLASEADVMYIWWDEGGPSQETYGRYRIFDRETGVWLFESLKDILVTKNHTGGKA